MVSEQSHLLGKSTPTLLTTRANRSLQVSTFSNGNWLIYCVLACCIELKDKEQCNQIQIPSILFTIITSQLYCF